MLSVEQIWRALETVPDPEIPVVSVCELGIVRDVRVDDMGTTVIITPTYSGCPATEAIERAIRETLEQAGAAPVRVERSLSPAWTSDWITPAAAEKLRAYGIAPPGAAQPVSGLVRFVERAPACPRCGGKRTQRLSEFGSTACKALYRCTDCAEPFDYFKPI
jgi:ring-1,2-phenylacetyl-CoA epoxidase subunit PaaD